MEALVIELILVGAGGVGTAVARIAARRGFLEHVVVADHDLGRAQRAAQAGDRFTAVRLDASDREAVVQLLAAERCDTLLNAVDPRFVMPLFDAAFQAGVRYLDMAMSLYRRHPEQPFSKPGVKLGDEQFEQAKVSGRTAGCLLWSAWASSPGLADVFARYAADRPVRRRSTRSASVTGPTSRWAGTNSPRFFDLDHDRGVPEPARHVRDGTRAGSPPPRSPNRKFSSFRRGSARLSASTSSTRRSSSSHAGSTRGG